MTAMYINQVFRKTHLFRITYGASCDCTYIESRFNANRHIKSFEVQSKKENMKQTHGKIAEEIKRRLVPFAQFVWAKIRLFSLFLFFKSHQSIVCHTSDCPILACVFAGNAFDSSCVRVISKKEATLITQ